MATTAVFADTAMQTVTEATAMGRGLRDGFVEECINNNRVGSASSEAGDGEPVILGFAFSARKDNRTNKQNLDDKVVTANKADIVDDLPDRYGGIGSTPDDTVVTSAHADTGEQLSTPRGRDKVTTLRNTAKYAVRHDGAVHDPLGAGAYAYEKDFTSAQLDYLGLPTIHAGRDGRELAPPGPTTLYVHLSVGRGSASPHMGIAALVAYAFLHAKDLKRYHNNPEMTQKDVVETFEVEIDIKINGVDSVETRRFEVDGVEYHQENMVKSTEESLADLKELVHKAAVFAGEKIQWSISTTNESARNGPMPGIDAQIISQVIHVLLSDKERLEKELFPKTGALAIRRPCPVEGCGIVEVDGKKNGYVKAKRGDGYESIDFYCPEHGLHTVHINDSEDVMSIDFGTPLDNLVRALAYGLETNNALARARAARLDDSPSSDNINAPVHLFVTGAEWAGMYNENLIWRQLLELTKKSAWVGGIAPPVIAYAPTIQDWSGSRLSTSLALDKKYEYLKDSGLGYILSFAEMKRQGKDVERLFEAVEGWMRNPYKLFRPYSVEYVHRIVFGADNDTTTSDNIRQFVAVHDNNVLDSPGRGAEFYGTEYITSHIRHLGLPSADDLFHAEPRVSDAAWPRRLWEFAQWVKRTFQGILGIRRQVQSSDTQGGQFLPTTLIVHVGAQPNNSPHAGTVTVFVLAFLLAREIKEYYADLRDKVSNPAAVEWLDDLEVVVQLDLVDTAPDKKRSQTVEGLEYQRSQRFTKEFHKLIPDYDEVMMKAAEFVGGGIQWRKEYQTRLTGMKNVPKIVEIMLEKRGTLGWEISPKSGDLGLRRACPAEGCGFAEKHGRKTQFERLDDGSYKLDFFCFEHGIHSVHTSNAEEVQSLEFNTPLRNLLRGLAYGLETSERRAEVSQNIQAGVPYARTGRVPVHMRVTGADYTGSYSENLFWRQLFLLSRELETMGLAPLTTPVIAYAPLILDWSGSKISKSLYVKKGAYQYLRENGMGYFLSYADMKEQGKDIGLLFGEVERWVKDPKGLFRFYSVDYLHGVFEEVTRGEGDNGTET